MLVTSAGTTNTGAIDDLGGAADMAEEEGLWLHVDAAYGGFFMLTERGRESMRGIERADSVALDPHKGLFLPYGNGSLLVRHPEFRAIHAAIESRLLRSCHDLSEGGLAVAAAEMAFAGGFGVEIDLRELSSDMGTGITPLIYEAKEAEEVWFCGCKSSGKKPVCDGTHNSL